MSITATPSGGSAPSKVDEPSLAARARLDIFESQAVFAVLLDTLAHPGRPASFPRKLVDRVPPALLAVLALADVDVRVAIVGGDEDLSMWARVASSVCDAMPVELGDADIVTVLGVVTATMVRGLRRGTAAQPELGARMIVACRNIDTDPTRAADAVHISLSGPGVPSIARVAITGPSTEALEALARVNDDFPAGVDTWFVDDSGRAVGVPRSSRLDVVMTHETGRI